MGVICNGLQKSGVRLLQRAVELMGWTPAPDKFSRTVTKREWRHEPYGPGFCTLGEHEVAYTHIPYPADIGKHQFIGIIRDPRNVLISAYRWQYRHNPLTATEARTSLEHMMTPRFFMRASQFVDWPRHRLVFRFEDMVGPSREIHVQVLADILEVEIDAETIAAQMIGGTRTYQPQHSRWQDIWTPDLDKRWKERGGEDLVKAYGYTQEGEEGGVEWKR